MAVGCSLKNRRRQVANQSGNEQMPLMPMAGSAGNAVHSVDDDEVSAAAAASSNDQAALNPSGFQDVRLEVPMATFRSAHPADQVLLNDNFNL